MTVRTKADWIANLATTFDDGGQATAAEFRQVMNDLTDSIDSWVSDARGLKIAKGTVTAADPAADFVITTGLSSSDTIHAVSIGAEYSTDNDAEFMPPNFTDSNNFHFQYYVNGSGNIQVRIVDASNLNGRTFKWAIWYA